LVWTAKFGRPVAVQKLLDEGADVGVTSDKDLTPLVLVAENGHEATVKVTVSSERC
jgi:ankyrin repeat protein